jgi:DNA-binding protein HU-beta
VIVLKNQSITITAFMNKKQLIKEMQSNCVCAVKKQVIEAVLNSFTDTIEEQVMKGNKVTIVGFGSFEKRDRAARRGRNPKSGEIMEIPAMSVPAFSAGKNFKKLVGSSHEDLDNLIEAHLSGR